MEGLERCGDFSDDDLQECFASGQLAYHQQGGFIRNEVFLPSNEEESIAETMTRRNAPQEELSYKDRPPHIKVADHSNKVQVRGARAYATWLAW